MTDIEFDNAIAKAAKLADPACVRALLALRDHIRAEHTSDADSDRRARLVARVSNTLERIVNEAHALRVWEDHLRASAAEHGAAATLVDLEELAIVARHASVSAEICSMRTWNTIAATPIDGADRRTLLAVSRALCAQYVFREREGMLRDAQELQERRLELLERISPPAHDELQSCLTDLIATTAHLGDREASEQYRARRAALHAAIDPRTWDNESSAGPCLIRQP